MGRPRRVVVGDMGYHVLNRAHGRQSLFRDEKDYVAFERVLVEAGARVHMRVLASCVLPNHWPLVLWPRADGALSHCVG
jgi:putative transposase